MYIVNAMDLKICEVRHKSIFDCEEFHIIVIKLGTEFEEKEFFHIIIKNKNPSSNEKGKKCDINTFQK